MNIQPKTDKILEIQAYKGGASQAEGVSRLIRLASNECNYGPSPKAIEAISQHAADAHRYPDGTSHGLRAALSEYLNAPIDQIICGSGSDEIISLLISAFVGDGDEVLYSQHGFLMYKISTLSAGGTPVAAPETDLRTDIDAMLSSITSKTKMIFVANPNNPTGSYLTRDELAQLHAAIPENILLVIDAAYREYATPQDYSDGKELMHHGNVVVTGTFSKLFGLGGMRVGWGYMSEEIADILNRVRGPFNVNSLAQIAAIAALKDTQWQQKMISLNQDIMARFIQRLGGIGIKTHPSIGNFILADFEDVARADKVDAALQKRGILIRKVASYGLPSRLRITIGTEEEMQIVGDALDEIMRQE